MQLSNSAVHLKLIQNNIKCQKLKRKTRKFGEKKTEDVALLIEIKGYRLGLEESVRF